MDSVIRRLLFKGDLGLAEAYIDGSWNSPDLTGLLLLLARNQHRLTDLAGMSRLVRLLMRAYHWSRRNSPAGSARNIQAHYDLGNAFYAQWLDSSMTYSSAIFDHPDQSLESAQENKYQRLLAILEAKPGQRILEIGCGWGGFAVAAARQGIRVDGITLSPAQLAWAQRRVETLQLGDMIKFSLDDYRNLQGSYDHIVSIEMFEAVGEAYWPTYMQTLKRLLKPGGRAALQVITIAESAFENYRRNPDFIQRYIFPGGMLPSPTHLRQLAAGADLKLLDDASFGSHYAETLRRWHAAFNRQRATLALAYDERFLRMWSYYLSYCEAGFRTGHIDLHQSLFENPG
jgi:cyclopropane-fatty-acyl-phospholipid synthase